MPYISTWLVVRSTTNQKGFTLIELLVAISIIALLVGIGFSSLGAVQRSGRDAQRESDLRTIQSALQQYYSDNNYYPQDNNLDDLSPVTGKVYLKSLPKDPQTDEIYEYNAGSDASTTDCDNADPDPAKRCHYFGICANLEGQSATVSDFCTGYNFEVTPTN